MIRITIEIETDEDCTSGFLDIFSIDDVDKIIADKDNHRITRKVNIKHVRDRKTVRSNRCITRSVLAKGEE